MNSVRTKGILRGDWTDRAVEHVVDRLTEVPLAEREAILAGPRDHATHIRLFDAIDAFRQIEVGGAAPRRAALPGAARVMFWNTERLRAIDGIEATVRAEQADICLLSEVDRGMARSGNIDCLAAFAARMGWGYAYGMEVVELGLGSPKEAGALVGRTNALGFHGGALATDLALHRPFLCRIERAGGWFDGSRKEPRVGGTIALGAQVTIAGVPVTVVETHLDNYATPEGRADEVRQLLRHIESYDPESPVVIGGDFNTSSASFEERWGDRAAWLRRVEREPDLLLHPERYEPLFDLMAEAGFDWARCNVAGRPTFPTGEDAWPRAKLDWFFTRGLVARDPGIISGVGADGSVHSDHDGLAVTVSPQ
ncbi:MAG TPA: endonuclease/exonuclease/phosphatase family protein [Dongiaceae bacterium]|nr:endonuclease/exonuclease/phosphatase family protein [Dongiaceae bacterium]